MKKETYKNSWAIMKAEFKWKFISIYDFIKNDQ